MANILKAGRSYSIPQGLGTSSGYMVIDKINFDKQHGGVFVTVSVWASKEFKASENGAGRTDTYLIQREIGFVLATLLPYFFVIDPDGNTKTVRDLLLTHAYLALAGIQPEIPGVNWDDWQPDVSDDAPRIRKTP